MGRHGIWFKLIVLIAVVGVIYLLHKPLLTTAGHFLIQQHTVAKADAAVVLNTGLNIYARLLEAARLYSEGVVAKVAINGDRKNDLLRALEARGYQPAAAWYINHLSLLEFLGVPQEDVLIISAQDAYDTISEAAFVGRQLVAMGVSSVLLTTSKFHTRRAGYIWRNVFSEQLDVYTIAARDDPFDPDSWWRYGRQIRWVMAEYGAWAFYYWKKFGL